METEEEKTAFKESIKSPSYVKELCNKLYFDFLWKKRIEIRKAWIRYLGDQKIEYNVKKFSEEDLIALRNSYNTSLG